MKETGVLFNPAMSDSLRREVDPKTQTRRVVKPQPVGSMPEGWSWQRRGVEGWYAVNGQHRGESLGRCPYGEPGDRLWVRETFFAFGGWVTRFNAKKGRDEWHFVDMTLETGRAYQFVAPAEYVKAERQRGSVTPTWWRRPAIFMPRAASRITLEVTGVRVERLWEISVADVQAEGCPHAPKTEDAAGWYRTLWEQLNGLGSWDANPMVWVVAFRRIEP